MPVPAVAAQPASPAPLGQFRLVPHPQLPEHFQLDYQVGDRENPTVSQLVRDDMIASIAKRTGMPLAIKTFQSGGIGIDVLCTHVLGYGSWAIDKFDDYAGIEGRINAAIAQETRTPRLLGREPNFGYFAVQTPFADRIQMSHLLAAIYKGLSAADLSALSGLAIEDIRIFQRATVAATVPRVTVAGRVQNALTGYIEGELKGLSGSGVSANADDIAEAIHRLAWADLQGRPDDIRRELETRRIGADAKVASSKAAAVNPQDDQIEQLLAGITKLAQAAGIIRKDIELLDGPTALMVLEDMTGEAARRAAEAPVEELDDNESPEL